MTNGAASEGAGASTTERGRFLRHLRLEDGLLFAWLVFVGPLLLPAAGSGTSPGAVADPLQGLLDLLALVGLVACIGARSAPGVVSGLLGGADFRYAVGPLVGAFAFALDDTIAKLGLEGGADGALILGLVGVALLARWRLPPLAAGTRRTLVTPFILVTSGYFGGFLSGIAGIYDLRKLVGDASTDPGAVAVALGLGTLGMLVFYAMLVFAPRQVAEREGTALAWTLRFLLFLVGLSLGTTWTGLRGG